MSSCNHEAGGDHQQVNAESIPSVLLWTEHLDDLTLLSTEKQSSICLTPKMSFLSNCQFMHKPIARLWRRHRHLVVARRNDTKLFNSVWNWSVIKESSWSSCLELLWPFKIFDQLYSPQWVTPMITTLCQIFFTSSISRYPSIKTSDLLFSRKHLFDQETGSFHQQGS